MELAKSLSTNYFPERQSSQVHGPVWIYILADVNRTQLVLGLSAQILHLKRFLELSSGLNPRYGAPAANRLVYLKSFLDPSKAGKWLLKLNHYTRIQKERLILSDNPNWINLWENHSSLNVNNPLGLFNRKKKKFRSRRRKSNTPVDFQLNYSSENRSQTGLDSELNGVQGRNTIIQNSNEVKLNNFWEIITPSLKLNYSKKNYESPFPSGNIKSYTFMDLKSIPLSTEKKKTLDSPYPFSKGYYLNQIELFKDNLVDMDKAPSIKPKRKLEKFSKNKVKKGKNPSNGNSIQEFLLF